MSAVIDENPDRQNHLHSQTNPAVYRETNPLVMSKADGAVIFDADGTEYIEGMASLWCAALGFSNPRLAEAAFNQMQTLSTYHTFNYRSNEPCIELTKILTDLSPIDLGRIFYVNSGSEANETMVKLAWHYHVARGEPNRTKIISRVGAFHGSAVFTASLCGLPHMHEGFNLPNERVVYAGRPSYYHDAEFGETETAFVDRLVVELEDLIQSEGPETIAAMIAEPVMGAGGVLVPPKNYFPAIQAVLKKHNILLLSDEVVCGFGRTGNWFGCQTFDFEPDMLSLAKGISSGAVPIGAVMINRRVSDVIEEHSERLGTWGHGFTYSGHPTTAAVAVAAIKSYIEMDAPKVAQELGEVLLSELQRHVSQHPLVGEIRCSGFVAGIEIVQEVPNKIPFPKEDKVGAQIEKQCRAQGIIVRNMGDVIALCPPFIITPDQIKELVKRLKVALDSVYDEVAA